MRASLPLMVAMALACHTAPCLAQATPDKSPEATSGKPPQATPAPQDKSGGGQTPSSSAETGHIDALSPDEARRIERARARAAAKTQATKTQAAKVQPSAAKGAEPAPTRAAGEPHAPSLPARDASNPKQAAPAAPTEAEKTPAPSKEAPAKEAATPPAPAAQATRDARATERPEKARPHAIRQAARPIHIGRPRSVANLEPRRFRQRPDWPPTRRAQGELAERTPRVGDVVPPDVPLYPVPPGYVPHRDYPPFPRTRDQAEDDYAPPPPRRVFMEPY